MPASATSSVSAQRAHVALVRLVVTLIAVLAVGESIAASVNIDASIEALYQREAALAEAQGWSLAREEFRATPFSVTIANLTKWVAAMIALSLVWLAASRPAALMLALFLAFNAYTGDALRYAGVQHPLLDRATGGFIFLALAAMLRFAALFPRPLSRADVIAAAGRMTARVRVKALLLDARAVWGTALLLVALDVLLPSPRTFGHQMAAFTLTLTAIAASVLLLRTGYRLVDDAGRRRILWIVAAFAGLLVSGVLYMAVTIAFRITNPAASMLLAQIPELVMLTCLAVGIFYYGGIDPALVIRQTTMYGALALLLVVLFEGVENVASDLLTARFGLPGGVGSLVAGTVVALGFSPLRQLARRGTDRLLGRLMPVTTLARAPREHAVVVFSDLVGYTELSARDEHAALILAALFHKTARRVAESHDGRLVKTIGDAVLLVFDSGVRATAAVRELQAALRNGAATLELAAPQLRTGMHCGMVAQAPDGDVFGDAVNLASRLQTTAAPGEVLASREVIAMEGVNAGEWEAGGARTLRNVPAPVETFRAALA